MTITKVIEGWAGETTTYAELREYARVFTLISDDETDRLDEVILHPDLPKRWIDHYGSDAKALCANLSASRDSNDPLVIQVTANYSTAVDPRDPLEKPPLVGLQAVQYTRPAIRDRFGNPYLNPAGDRILGIEVDDARGVLPVHVNLPPHLPQWVLTYWNAVNDADITIKGVTFPAQTLMFTDMTIPNETSFGGIDNDTEYYPVDFKLSYRRETWKIMNASQGYNRLEVVQDDDTGDDVVIKQSILVGEPPERPSEAQWIDQHGHHIDKLDSDIPLYIDQPFETNPIANPTIAEKRPLFIRAEEYRPLPFSVLNLPA